MKIHPPPVAHPPCLAPNFPHVQGIKNIEHDLGITRGGSPATAVDPHGNFPYITDKHRSLTCKALKRNPELYAKYANVKVKWRWMDPCTTMRRRVVSIALTSPLIPSCDPPCPV